MLKDAPYFYYSINNIILQDVIFRLLTSVVAYGYFALAALIGARGAVSACAFKLLVLL